MYKVISKCIVHFVFIHVKLIFYKPKPFKTMSNAGQILIIHVKYTTKKIYSAVPSNKKSFVLKLKNKSSIDFPICKSYICAKFQNDWIIFALVIVRQLKHKFFQK